MINQQHYSNISQFREASEKLLVCYNKKQIVSSLIKTFMNQPNINKPNAYSLCNITDISDEVIWELKLDEKATSRDPWLIYILLQNVNLETRQAWGEKINDDFLTFETFSKLLSNRSAMLEMYNNNDCSEIKFPKILNFFAMINVSNAKEITVSPSAANSKS